MNDDDFETLKATVLRRYRAMDLALVRVGEEITAEQRHELAAMICAERERVVSELSEVAEVAHVA